MLRFYSLLLTLLFVACTSNKYEGSHPESEPKDLVTVMTFNTENLFDTKDDPGKKDETYLPIAEKKGLKHQAKCNKVRNPYYRKSCLEKDWNAQILKEKVQRLASVILQEKRGQGPEVVVLEEVENINALNQLRDQLNVVVKRKYESILVEGPDERGIDVAMLSKLPVVGKPQLHEVKLRRTDGLLGRPTRGILQADLQLPNKKLLTVLGVHFPSAAAPTVIRKQAVDRLNEVQKSLPSDRYVIATGDFNINRKDEAKSQLYSKELGAQWLVSHEIGCKDCPGTHNYRGKWSFLDALLFSKNMSSGPVKVKKDSIRLVNNLPMQVDNNGTPARFKDGKSAKGVSDHWPLAVDIKLQ